jgi:hypothetical protein
MRRPTTGRATNDTAPDTRPVSSFDSIFGLPSTRAQVELMSTEPGPQAVRRLLTELMDLDEVNRLLTEKITATGIRYDFGAGPDLLGRRLRDLEVKQGTLYDLLHRGRAVRRCSSRPAAPAT